jgi:L-serine dehydratase
MMISTFELFKQGVGPSSSHTMGPMIAAAGFVDELAARGLLPRVSTITVTLYGSLALTGRGHATDRAVQLGLMGLTPDRLDPDAAESLLQEVAAQRTLRLQGARDIIFDRDQHIVWAKRERLARHANALKIEARDDGEAVLAAETYYSIGGGFVISESDGDKPLAADNRREPPFPFASAEDLLRQASEHGLTIAELMLANELAWRGESEIVSSLDAIASAMNDCIDRGLRQTGQLPGHLGVARRARPMFERLELKDAGASDPLAAMDRINLWAMAVNEENAAGGRVVTAPTNGAAGVIPAVLRYYDHYHRGTSEGRRIFLLTAAAIGALYKRNASISGAEVGCQGEVGVACSMAAGALCAVLGGTNRQIENAAEIGMEHNLGLTCDPIGGLVQIPCIERNAMGAVKAVDAAKIALLGDGIHHVSLDRVIDTMKRTGADMNEIYKETSLGGLAVNQVEC